MSEEEQLIEINTNELIIDIDSFLKYKKLENDDEIKIDNNVEIKNVSKKKIFISIKSNKHDFYKLNVSKKVLLADESLKFVIQFQIHLKDLEQNNILRHHKFQIKIFILEDEIENLDESNVDAMIKKEKRKQNKETFLNVVFIYKKVEKEIEESKNKIIEFENKITELEKKINGVNNENLENKITELEKKINGANNENLENKITELEKKINGANNEKLENKITELEKKINESNNENLEKKITELEKKINELNNQNIDYGKKINEIGYKTLGSIPMTDKNTNNNLQIIIILVIIFISFIFGYMINKK